MPTALSDSELLARLVSFDSTSAYSNLPLVDWIADYLDRPGVRISRHPSPDQRKANLFVALGPEGDAAREGLMLCGHLDVVPAGEGWETDPFQLTVRDDRYIARGACDMKGFVALAVNVAHERQPERLRHPLTLLFTYDEEVGTLGARHFVETWGEPEMLPRRTLIGEPTSLCAVRTHKGHLKLAVTLDGRAAHSAYPHLGRNAIEPAGPVLLALTELKERLARERPPGGADFPDVPYIACNVTRIAGGTAVNVIPERCVLDVSVRLLPGIASQDVVDRVRSALDARLGHNAYELEVTGESPALALDERADLFQAVRRLSRHDTHGVSFATDGGWLQRLGLECVVFGPGSIAVAHQPNEWVPAAELIGAREVVEQLVDRFTGEARA